MELTDTELQAEITAAVEHCRVLNAKIDGWEKRLSRFKRTGRTAEVIASIEKSIGEFKTRRGVSEVRIDLCREILLERHDATSAGMIETAGAR